jgi:uncharacterized membrane protein YfcA
MDLESWRWALGALAAYLIGLSKTAVPGVATPVVPFLAAVFGSRASVGIMVLMLICGDCFAIAWYRRHAQWRRLIGLLPWVLVGMGLGAGTLGVMGRLSSGTDYLGLLIGLLVVAMVILHMLQRRIPAHLTPRSSAGTALIGVAAGFATTTANAAGPVMAIYFLAHRLTKEQFLGTAAWYFFTLNVSKVPVYMVLTALNPDDPVITLQSLWLVLGAVPALIGGAVTGRWILPRIPQKSFDAVVLVLAIGSALYLIVRSL